MFRSSNDFKIFWPVVQFIVVLVVDYLISSKSSSNDLLHYGTMRNGAASIYG